MSKSPAKLVVLRPRAREAGEQPHDRLPGLEEVLSLHLDVLYRTARILTGTHTAAEDLVQEAALRACKGWDGLRSIPSARPWLLRILHRTFLNSRRSENRRPDIVDIDVEALVLLPLTGLDFGARLHGAPLGQELMSALDDLPPAFREAVWLVDVEELKLAEAAEVLGLPVGTAASRVHRGRRLLRERLRNSIEGSDPG